jgi:tripartite-type tricarboxylate transporter receptor subunit TctC
VPIFGLVTAFCAAHAQTGKWPEKPVRIIIASAPGGGDDFVTRLIAPKLVVIRAGCGVAKGTSSAR